MYGPDVAILLMYRSHGMKHTKFPQVDDGQRDPRDRGVTLLIATRLALLPGVLLRSMRLIMRRLFLLWLDFLLSGLLLSFLRLINGHSFIWMSKLLFLIVNS